MSDESVREWRQRQLNDANISQAVQTSVLRLLEVWDTMNHTPDTREQTLGVFQDLVNQKALVEAENPAEVWVQAKPGQLVVRNEVRVKRDAFPPERGGLLHNGRRGVIVGIRYGDIIVDYRDGIQPALVGVHHPPAVLEVRRV